MNSQTLNKTYQFTDQDRLETDGSPRYVMRVRDLELPDKPREKLLAAGPSGLTMAELVAILWGVGTKKEEVLTMARRLFKEYGEQTIRNETNPSRLAEVLDIPVGKACQIIACLELGRRFYATSSYGQPCYIRTTQQAYHYLADIVKSPKEQLRGLYLNSRYQVIHDEVISVGSLTANIVHPREVFRPAIEHGAVAVIIAHNHPSGSLEPTSADLEITEQLRAAGEIMGIQLLDHLVIGETSYKSIVEGQT
jgi:DNA repair protein RadC